MEETGLGNQLSRSVDVNGYKRCKEGTPSSRAFRDHRRRQQTRPPSSLMDKHPSTGKDRQTMACLLSANRSLATSRLTASHSQATVNHLLASPHKITHNLLVNSIHLLASRNTDSRLTRSLRTDNHLTDNSRRLTDSHLLVNSRRRTDNHSMASHLMDNNHRPTAPRHTGSSRRPTDRPSRLLGSNPATTSGKGRSKTRCRSERL